MVLFHSLPVFAQDDKSETRQNQGAPAKFLPDISLNVDFSGVYRNLDQNAFGSLYYPGYAETEYGDTINPLNGFNFNYAEFGMYSAVDPFFDLSVTFHLTVDTFEIEEAYARTLSLPANLQLKLGKFLSSFGRLNEVHAHAWDFSDQPLVYHVFFGMEDLNEIGLRLTWLIPAPFYLLAGAEALTGRNPVSFGSTGFSNPGGTMKVDNGSSPEIYLGYLKTSFDLNDLVILAGVSAANGTKRFDNGILSTDGYGVSGNSTILGTDLTLKWIVDASRFLAWQTEYLYRIVDGNMYYNSGTNDSYTAKQSGLYSQIIFQFTKGLRTGFRFDLLQKNEVLIGGASQNYVENSTRYSLMLEYAPSEFSRFRLQYNYDPSGYNGSSATDNHQIAINANFHIGSHGSHSF